MSFFVYDRIQELAEVVCAKQMCVAAHRVPFTDDSISSVEPKDICKLQKIEHNLLKKGQNVCQN